MEQAVGGAEKFPIVQRWRKMNSSWASISNSISNYKIEAILIFKYPREDFGFGDEVSRRFNFLLAHPKEVTKTPNLQTADN